MAEEEVQEEKKSGSGKGLIIILIVMMFLMMIGMGVLTFLLLSKDGDKKEASHAEEQHADAEHGAGHGEDAHAEAAHDDGVVRSYSPKFKQFDPPEPGSPPLYFAMEPFVVNFKGDGQAKFLAVTLKFMSHYPQLVGEHGELEHMRPILRNDITSLLRIQHFNELNQDNGPDLLRARILEKAREVIKHHNIYPDLLEDVYFERFVMQ